MVVVAKMILALASLQVTINSLPFLPGKEGNLSIQAVLTVTTYYSVRLFVYLSWNSLNCLGAHCPKRASSLERTVLLLAQETLRCLSRKCGNESTILGSD